MTNTPYGRITAGLIGMWFVFCAVGSALHIFWSDASHPPIALGLAVLTPIIVFALWSAASEGFRQFTRSLSPRALTSVHAWRIAGFAFLVAYAYGKLPAVFAFPAGFGDIAIGATALWAAKRLATPEHRGGFMLWQALGTLDLVTAVTVGTTATFLFPHGIPTSAVTVLPLSLIPTFAVPLLTILHFICIGQARQWPVAVSHHGQPRHAEA